MRLLTDFARSDLGRSSLGVIKKSFGLLANNFSKIYRLWYISLIIFSISSCKVPPVKKHEVRAVWMSRFEYAQGKSAHESKQYIRSSFRQFHDAGLNMILFQVRGNGDAFYHSRYEPWSDLLSGTLGRDPGWDPLQFALETAHHLGMELHVWINTFPAWKAGRPLPTESIPRHPLLAHPEWVVCDSTGTPMHPRAGYITFSPGNPQVQQHIRNVVMDLLGKYDVDGVHFDYIRYPEGTVRNGYSHDSVSVARFAAANPLQFKWNVWQREQINRFVGAVYNTITAAKPWVKVSAAVIGYHHGVRWNGYSAVMQDARRWLATGKIDLLFPMTYTRINHPTAPYTAALQQWKEMRYLGGLINPGIATYKVGGKYTWKEIWKEIERVRKDRFPGMVFFSATSLLKALNTLHKKYYPRPALFPPMPWKEVPIEKPLLAEYHLGVDTLHIRWRANPGIEYYVIYSDPDLSKMKNIIQIVPGSDSTTAFPLLPGQQVYYLTAVNRTGMESSPLELYPLQNISLTKQVEAVSCDPVP